MNGAAARPTIALLGADGQVGRELRRSLLPLGEVHPLVRADCDLARPAAVLERLAALRPAIVVNAAAYTAVDKAESDEATAMAVNAALPAALAAQAAECGWRLVHYSTDYVFDGRGRRPLREDEPTAPQSAYGRSKLAGEQAVLRHADALVLRLAWVFGQHGGNFPRTMLRLAAEREALRVVADQQGCPTPAALVADITLLALRAGLRGLYHLATHEPTTWHAYAQETLALGRQMGLPGLKAGPENVAPIASADFPTPAARPAYSVLDGSRLEAALGLRMPSWRPYLQQFVRELAEAAR